MDGCSDQLLCLCLAFRTDDIDGLELLRWEDQKKIRDYVQSGASAGPAGPSLDTKTTSKASGIEVSQTSRATCRLCSQRILKGEVGN